jgi:hypothetical protein
MSSVFRACAFLSALSYADKSRHLLDMLNGMEPQIQELFRSTMAGVDGEALAKYGTLLMELFKNDDYFF